MLYNMEKSKKKPSARRMHASEARKALAELMELAGKRSGRIILTRYGNDVAALISAGDLKLLEAIEDAIDVEMARRALAEKGPAIPWEEVKRELRALERRDARKSKKRLA